MNYLRRKVLVEMSILALLATMSTAKSAPTLATADPHDIIRMLKLLRSPEYSAMVPVILPLLNHETANVVRDTCRTLAVIANKDVVPSIEPLLKDKRAEVRKDAEDAIDKLRADRPGNQGDAKQSVPVNFSANPKYIIPTLKLMRSPEYAPAAPALLPFLNHENANVVRDACRTLAVIANKDVIPSIEPLLKDKRADVRKDAQDAVDKLRSKS